MKIDLTDQIVVITGAAGNLGAALVRAYRNAGAKLALVDRSPDRLPAIFADLADAAEIFFAPATDVTNAESVDASIHKIIDHFGRIDALVNTAGGYRAGTPVHQTPLSDWDLMLNLNAKSVFITCRAVIPQMLEQGSGKIVNIASRAALGGDANHAAYSASKTAVVRLTESLAQEVKVSGLNVNCVMPGIIDTPINREAMKGADYSKWVAPEAIADVILFLTSDAARAINGAAVPVFGKG
jgi:NAD(P)-dependent dehydrogenase (short-subunit alcohol dehydrogenase family)